MMYVLDIGRRGRGRGRGVRVSEREKERVLMFF